MVVNASDLIAPDDLDALAVHADALIERGSFLGEVIAAQLALYRAEGDQAQRTRLATEARALLMKNSEQLFGKFAPHVVSVVPKNANEPTGQYAACTASWRLGVIDEVALATSAKMALPETIIELAKLPIARYLRSIIAGTSVPASSRYAPSAYNKFLNALVKHAPAFPRLKSLFLGDLGDQRLANSAGSLHDLYDAFPDLETLRIRANEVRVGKTIRLPKLRVLEFVGQCASLETLERVHASSLAELTEVTMDNPSRNGDLFRNALEQVRDAPKLTRLALRNFSGDDKIATLVAWRGLSRLTELDLSYCDLDAELRPLADNFDRFLHLERLDLRFNNFATSATLVGQLRELLPKATFAGQVAPRRV